MRPSELDPDRWHHLDELLDVVLATPPADRDAFLDEACADDEQLRTELEALIAAHADSEPFFEAPLELPPEALAAASSAVAAGRRVGPFRIDGEIGRGGMGVVYLAEDTRLGRKVALKALPPYLGVGPRARERFRSEARVISRLDHPNIGTLYEVGETDAGQLYMVFAYYPGETLAQRIGRGPLPVDEALAIAAGIAAGLEAAHAEGIIHRDVKPSNVLLAEGGGVKLLDFGVAKVAGEDVTRDGVLPGTLAYMSPEQLRGDAIDHRTDIWSLGVVLYEMLTGRRPFEADGREELRRAIIEAESAPVGSLREDVPDSVDVVVATMLRKSPRVRYPSVAGVLSDLEALRASRVPAIAAQRAPSAMARFVSTFRGRTLAWAGALTLVAAAAVAWQTLDRSGAGPQIRRLAVLPPDDLTGEPGREAFLNGVHDALVVELGRLGLFDVVSRASMMRYRGSALSLDEIADAQDVDALLATSVLRDGDSLAVTAQLLELHPERTVWADRYRRGVGDVFAIGSEIARSVAGELGGESPISDGRSTRTADPEAVDAYNFGVFHLEQRSREGFEQAVRYFELAIEEDSTFAPAYAGLAQAYGSSTFFGIGRPATNMPRIAELAETALELDGSLALAHTVLAAVDLYWNWDFESAEARARRAIELNPSDAGAHRLLSEVLAVDGRFDAALAEVERGSDLEPLLPFSAFRPIVVLLDKDDFDGAIERAREGLEFHPRFWQGYWLLCLALRGADRPTEAVPECEEAAKGSGRLPMALGALGQTYAVAGRRTAAESIARELEQRAARQYVGGSWIAAVEAGLGNPDRAFAWLERAYEERDVQLIGIRNGLLFDALRGDPRMDRLLARMGLSGPGG